MAQNWNQGGYNNVNQGGQNQYNNQYNPQQQNRNNQFGGAQRGGYNNMNRGGFNQNMNRGGYNNNTYSPNQNQYYNPNQNYNQQSQPHNPYQNNNPNPNQNQGWNQNIPPQQNTQPLQKPPTQKNPEPKKPVKSRKKMNNAREYDHLFKLVLIGDATVGKTSLLLRFADDSFKDNYISTIGVDFRFRTLTINGDLVKLQIWDTAGQERFRTITSAYYRGADGIIMVYDITNIRTFEHMQGWLDEVHKVTGSTITKLIIGNKNDLLHRRQVDINQAQQYALSVGASIIETSAKTANNVDKSFTMIAQELVKRGSVQRKSIHIRQADEDDDDDDDKKKCCQII
eukprot:917953_1